MTFTQHTPGPWTIGGELVSKAGTDTEIASVWCRHRARQFSPLSGEAEANRRLIAAAPDLLAACERVLRSIEWSYTEDRMTEDEQAGTLRAALAKASP